VVGAGALNQAMKALAIARGYLLASGIDLWCRPDFTEVQINGQPRTALHLLIKACAAEEGAGENAGEGPGG
jgi:stage V sporulation protein S